MLSTCTCMVGARASCVIRMESINVKGCLIRREFSEPIQPFQCNPSQSIAIRRNPSNPSQSIQYIIVIHPSQSIAIHPSQSTRNPSQSTRNPSQSTRNQSQSIAIHSQSIAAAGSPVERAARFERAAHRAYTELGSNMPACARVGLGDAQGCRGWRSSNAHGIREAAKETRAAQRGAEGE